VSGEDFPKSKPDPAILYTLSLSIASKANCIVIEDSTNGVRAAKAAGIYCVGTIVFILKRKIYQRQMLLLIILQN
jgi:beta-phosphoglucomutase-like phosphatase (HAD superfamily)